MHIEKQATGKVRSCNVKDVVLEPPVELLNIDTQFGRVGKYVNHLLICILYLFMINDNYSLYIDHCK